MNLWLAYNIALGVGLAIALAWAYDARKYAEKACRLVLRHEQPTEEIQLPATMKIGPTPEWWPPERR